MIARSHIGHLSRGQARHEKEVNGATLSIAQANRCDQSKIVVSVLAGQADAIRTWGCLASARRADTYRGSSSWSLLAWQIRLCRAIISEPARQADASMARTRPALLSALARRAGATEASFGAQRTLSVRLQGRQMRSDMGPSAVPAGLADEVGLASSEDSAPE